MARRPFQSNHSCFEPLQGYPAARSEYSFEDTTRSPETDALPCFCRAKLADLKDANVTKSF